MELTPNYKLKKPAVNDYYNVGEFNDNADILDAALKKLAEEKADLDGDGKIPGGQLPEQSAAEILFDDTAAGLGADNVQDAIEAVKSGLEEHTHSAYAPVSHGHAASDITAGTFAGAVVAKDDTAYTTYKVRNAALLSAVPTSMTNGRVAFVYS